MGIFPCNTGSVVGAVPFWSVVMPIEVEKLTTNLCCSLSDETSGGFRGYDL